MSSTNPYSATDVSVAPTAHAPRTVHGTLSKGLSLFFDRFVSIVVLVLVLWLPVECLNAYLTYELLPNQFDDTGMSELMGVLVTTISELLVGALFASTVIHLGSAAYMSESLSGFEAFIRGLSSWPRLVLNQVLFGLIATGAFILFIVPGIYVTVRLSLMDTVTVLEQQKGTAAVSRSFELTANNFGLVFLVGLVCLLINLSIFGLIALLQNYLPDQFSTWYAEALGSTLFDLQSGFSIMCMLVLWNDLKAESRLAPLQLPVPKQ